MLGSQVVGGEGRTSAGEAAGETLLPLRFLGMGLWIVWQWCTHSDPTLLLPGATCATDFCYFDVPMRVSDIATMVAVALLWRRLTPITSHKGLMGAAFAAAGVGTACMLVALNSGAFVPLACILSAGAAAFGGAVLFLSWAEVYSRLTPNRMMLFGMLSLILAGCVSFVLSNLATPYPLFSARSRRRSSPSSSAGCRAATSRPAASPRRQAGGA